MGYANYITLYNHGMVYLICFFLNMVNVMNYG